MTTTSDIRATTPVASSVRSAPPGHTGYRPDPDRWKARLVAKAAP